MPAIEGKVAAILNESLLVINVGSAAGVREGMIFAVLAEGQMVKDPDTGEELGRWELPKGHVRVVLAQPRMSTCEAVIWPPAASERSEGTLPLSAVMVADSMRRGPTEGPRPRLSVRRADITGLPEIGPIQVGDRVRALAETS